jgi:hypothetical protein
LSGHFFDDWLALIKVAKRQFAIEIERDQIMFARPVNSLGLCHDRRLTENAEIAKPEKSLRMVRYLARYYRQIMSQNYHIQLSGNDLGQLLDGLEIRAESWENTANYLHNEKNLTDEFILIEECSQPEEADNIANHYRSIVATVRKQMLAQS